MKQLTSLLLSLLLLSGLTGCGDVGVIGGADGPTNIIVSASSTPDQSQVPSENSAGSDSAVLPDGGASSSEADTGFIPIEGEYYYDLESVVLYLEYYGMLPDNYITQKEAQERGWSGGRHRRRPLRQPGGPASQGAGPQLHRVRPEHRRCRQPGGRAAGLLQRWAVLPHRGPL